MTHPYPEDDGPRIDAGRLWGGGIATAVVAGLLTEVGILIARGMLHLAILAPQGEGLWGDASTTSYAVAAGVVALVATGLLHFLLSTTPSATVFFGWIMALLTVVAVIMPLKVVGTSTEVIATVTLNLVLGVVVTLLLISAARGAQETARRRPYAQPQGRPQPQRYDAREW
ncbi:DUF6069 family protein [Streptacidiphilus sp. MAP5-3]|uniref:DUF6069 family protein n=1 Tax=unclassified Streptacidiphilus TaxID=2643834 RepID=UPI00351854AA